MTRDEDMTVDSAEPVPALAKVVATTAGDIAASLDLSEEALALLGDGKMPPAVYLAALMQRDDLADAVTFLAHALPKREGAWWAAQAVRTLDLGDETALARRVVRATEAWVVKPKEPARHAAMDLAEALGFDHAASWAAMAAFWAGDSLLPPDMAPVKPEPTLSCRAVAAAVTIAGAEGPGAEMPARMRALLAKGIDIANGGSGRDGAEDEGGGTIPGSPIDG